VILTLTWKELREHQGIWLTMAIMTVVTAWGLPFIVALGEPRLGAHIAALTLLGLTATYGVVCGSMMFAGEHEGGTLVFLDIFHGRRGLLWLGKFAIGCVLVVTQAAAVAVAFGLLNQEAPGWAISLVGGHGHQSNAIVWLLILPIVSLEGYAFGLLGSSFTQRVLAGATVAAVGVTPVWLFAILTPGPVFFALQGIVAVFVLVLSYAAFVNQSRETSAGRPPKSAGPADSKDQFLEMWEEFEREDDKLDEPSVATEPVIVPAAPLTSPIRPAPRPASSSKIPERAPSPNEVLWWLTFEQARPLLWILAPACLLIGLIMPANAQAIWPLATLLLGVICGTAAFAPEQRDLSFQFMSAQHFPLPMIWRFKLVFWFCFALLGTLAILVGHLMNIAVQGLALGPRNVPAVFLGTVPALLGLGTFAGIWLLYGFCSGQVFVWLCRKSILAVLISMLASGGAIGLWLPSLICGGMGGWQMWIPPLILLLATGSLMRAWASGRMNERKPLAALIGFGTGVFLWMLVNIGYRAIEVPDVGEPLDPKEFRASLPVGVDNAAGKAVNDAVAHFEDNQNKRWMESLAALPALPVGMVEPPRADLRPLLARHLPVCRDMAAELLRMAPAQEPGPALDSLAQVLALSRNLRNKASLESYQTGIDIERDALRGLDQLLARGKPTPKLLRRIPGELNRHALDTPPPLDCMRTECFRSTGFLLTPSSLVLSAPNENRVVPERWLTGGVALSLEVPWEEERNARIWQLVWAGLFRSLATPHWELPELPDDPPDTKPETRLILQCWLPSTTITRPQMIRLLNCTWLSDTRLFCSVTQLREASTRARIRVDSTRLAAALRLHCLEESKQAKELNDLTPKYLPTLPTDPYSGQSYGYRPAQGIQPAAVWSTGRDRIDHGGRNDGADLADADPQWRRGDFDLITQVPQ
jgi:hypothetical protein